ncbi:Voltage-gated Ion Channel (VIC) Superfamily [Achlya hypogyna]|uniref:Voltage-gated Ion Channel (VIC) Superfamily n=1 Tax=Achlya hypogyna TaxID=1202772 RepID=A0A1V9YHF1_ACHHY|nr:Voltage-gated Ion Channel (VIC) Superfamily [Achlya hypogyna]
MGEFICVAPEFVDNSKNLTSAQTLDDAATFDLITAVSAGDIPCVHTRDFVGQQLVAFAIVWGCMLLFSLLWMIASRRQNLRLQNDETGFSLALRQWARKSRFAVIMSRPVQFVASIGIFLVMVVRCQSYAVEKAYYYIGLVLYFIAFVDTIIRFFAAKRKLGYMFEFYTILDLLGLASYCCVGFAPSIVIAGKHTRTWLDLSVTRSIFVYRSYLEMERNFDKSEKGLMMARQGFKCFLLLTFAASVVFFFETTGEIGVFLENGFAHLYSCSNGTISSALTDDCSTETWSIMFAFYYTVVTLATVGYGDNSPHTVESRLLVIVFIVAGIVLFSMEVEHLVNLYKLRYIGNPPYSPKPRTQSVVIMGNPTFPQVCHLPSFSNGGLKAAQSSQRHSESCSIRTTFKAWCNATCMYAVSNVCWALTRGQAVVLGDRTTSKYVKGLIQKIETDPKFASRVTYVAGDPSRNEDLERARVKDSMAAFFLPDKLAADPVKEDAKNIMHILSTKQYAGSRFRCLAVVLKSENVRHMMAAGLDRDDIVCEDTMKLGVLAQSCVCPGFSTMIANLGSCLTLDTRRRSSKTILTKLQSALQTKQPTHHVLQSDVDAAETLYTEQLYYEGASREFYVVSLNKRYAELTFVQAAQKIFRESNGAVVLVAVEVVVDQTDDGGKDESLITGVRLVLNPGFAMELREGSRVYVIAEDSEMVAKFHICMNEEDDSAVVDAVQLDSPRASKRSRLRSDAPYSPDHAEDALRTTYRGLRSPTRLEKHKSVPTLSTTPPKPAAHNPRVLLSGESIHGDSVLSRIVTHVRMPKTDIDHRLRHLVVDDVLSLYSHRPPRVLQPPPLSVLQNPNHIVICSFLGEEALASLQWFISPLRGVFSLRHPPITILDASPVSEEWIAAISKFRDVYYVSGSPLVYRELQRAGAKSAASVVVLAKKSKGSGADAGLMETSIVDAEAIFTTMLIELNMDFTRMFTLTELTDESNSKFLNKKFVLSGFGAKTTTDTVTHDRFWEFWDTALSTTASSTSMEQAIYRMPLFMSGRLVHPQFCETVLVQSYYSQNIHRIIRQLIGGPRSTGLVVSVPLPKIYHHQDMTYGSIFRSFGASKYPGIVLGIYRKTSQEINAGTAVKELPIVLTTPRADVKMLEGDSLFVLYGWHAMEKACSKIQAAYRLHRVTKAPATKPKHIGRRKSVM